MPALAMTERGTSTISTPVLRIRAESSTNPRRLTISRPPRL
jgi:hypothetical protein